jgi:hypothetical protein
MKLAYLHGFASSPLGTKATFFRSRLAELAVDLEVPDLAPDFTHLTITSQVEIVERLLVPDGTILLGSSMGGYVASLVASRRPEAVRGLVLFAPAFHFVERWEASVGEATMQRWRERGTAPVFHYGRGREEPLSVELFDDARSYAAEPDPHCPALIFAGTRDEAVPLPVVEHFARARTDERELVVLEAGHELTEVLEPMWERSVGFLRRFGAI